MFSLSLHSHSPTPVTALVLSFNHLPSLAAKSTFTMSNFHSFEATQLQIPSYQKSFHCRHFFQAGLEGARGLHRYPFAEDIRPRTSCFLMAYSDPILQELTRIIVLFKYGKIWRWKIPFLWHPCPAEEKRFLQRILQTLCHSQVLCYKSCFLFSSPLPSPFLFKNLFLGKFPCTAHLCLKPGPQLCVVLAWFEQEYSRAGGSGQMPAEGGSVLGKLRSSTGLGHLTFCSRGQLGACLLFPNCISP